ncbi:hypothetical protein KPH14_003307 [Odynerus spinipes]|uniref:Uncharacterized protein n=1 Tax=Odynerus spinipes TaxID=1348599 RepID=A0AAD9RCF8_9HYME|nr:hypothetical protein KPH14_003307 [Odynerus spinipes]
MVIKNRCTKNNSQRMDYEIKPDLILFTQNKMLPILKSVPSKMSIWNYSVPTIKPRIIQLSKHENKSVLTFLQEPLFVFRNKDEKEQKVYQLTYDKSKIQKQKYPTHNKSESLKTSIRGTLKKFHKSRRLVQKKTGKYLPFPNTITVLNNEYPLHEKISNFNKEPSSSILKSSNSIQQKQQVRDQLYAKVPVSTEKQILLYKQKNALYNANGFQTITQNNFEEKRQKSVNYLDPITSNFGHIQNKDLTKTTALTFLKMRIANSKDSSIIPINESIFCDLIAPKIYTKNSTTQKNGNIKDNIHISYSEQIVKLVNYENKTLGICHPTIYNLNSSIEEKDIKRSVSAIQYGRPTQCIFDIKNNTSNSHIPQNKYNNQKNRPRFKVQYSSEDTDYTSMPENSTCIIKKCELKDNKQYIESGYDCRIKYSWQVIGTGSQTSKVLLYNFLEENKNQIYNNANQSSMYKCDVKYSWQIIGTGTQVALQNNNDTDYWTGIVFKPNIHQDGKVIVGGKEKKIDDDVRLYKVQPNGKKLLILNNQYTQTLTEKGTQSDFTDCKIKYSWQNLIWQHL